jgi:hypothetical protein
VCALGLDRCGPGRAQTDRQTDRQNQNLRHKKNHAMAGARLSEREHTVFLVTDCDTCTAGPDQLVQWSLGFRVGSLEFRVWARISGSNPQSRIARRFLGRLIGALGAPPQKPQSKIARRFVGRLIGEPTCPCAYLDRHVLALLLLAVAEPPALLLVPPRGRAELLAALAPCDRQTTHWYSLAVL